MGIESEPRRGLLAKHEGRFLGGRPPYGYQLADAGPHPNPSKAAIGQRQQRLEPDPVAAPIVGRIFGEYITGRGIFAIAEGLAPRRHPLPQRPRSPTWPGRSPTPTPADKAELYVALGVTVTYDPPTRTVTASVRPDARCSVLWILGGLQPLPHPTLGDRDGGLVTRRGFDLVTDH